MAKEVFDELMDHDYDGIQEYDNDLPPWWKNLFYITLIIAFFYVMHYHILGTGNLQEAEYLAMIGNNEATQEATTGGGIGYSSPYAGSNVVQQRTANTAELANATTGSTPEPVAQQALVVLTDEASRAAGKQIWKTNCAVCHLEDGGGMIGPNMTDEYWIHGGKVENLIKTINEGVLAKGMTPWKGILSDEKILQVASYILEDLVGSTPAVAKAPQGDKVSG